MIGNLNKRLQILIAMLICAVAGCSPLRSPPTVDRFQGIANSSDLKFINKKININNKKIAIVYSNNVSTQLAYNDKLKVELDGKPAFTALSSAESFSDDVNIVFDRNRLISGLIRQIKDRALEIFEATDIPDAFQRGADYVVLLDIHLAYTRNTNTAPSTIDAMHVAEASLIFIDKQLNAGPDISESVHQRQLAEEGGPGGNHGDFIRIQKEVRSKLINKVDASTRDKIY